MTPYERAQSVSFITRYEHLPREYPVCVIRDGEDWRIGNLDFLRHVLNDFRPLVQNQDDSVHYRKIHAVWRGMLKREDPADGMTIRVRCSNGSDVTADYISYLDQHIGAISLVVRAMDFSYLYNGLLQHSDPGYSQQLLTDYVSGEINYLLWKHALVLSFVREMLGPYYQVARVLTFPRLGPL